MVDAKKIHTVLIGKESSLNTTISKILKDKEELKFDFWTVGSLPGQLKKRRGYTIDVAIIDLRSFSEPPVSVVQKLLALEAIKEVLAIHIYSNGPPVDRLVEAGAKGYLTPETSEQQLLEAIDTLSRGEVYLGI